MANDDDPKTVNEMIGHAPVRFRGDALYFTQDGGTFEGEGVKGTVAATVGGVSVVVYIDGGGTYECSARDIVTIAIKHHKSVKP